LEPLIEIYDPVELSAASLSLASLPQNSEETSQNKPPIAKANTNPDEWTRLFVSIGTMEGVTPGTLLGALAGESEVDGNAFGKIDIRETFSLVEVLAKEAGKVIKAVNGVTIRGRSTRVDYDRGQKPNQGPTISKKR
jgi:ATP-dependent RNA helicase DeaD